MSKKLEKNGLWESSRMMLPEHREALLQRKEQDAVSTLPTYEELVLIKSYAILPALLNVVERNLQQMETTSYSLKKLYVTASLVLLNQIQSEFSAVKRALKDRNIRILQEEAMDIGMKYRYICRGYEGNFTLIRDVLKAEISKRLGQQITHLFDSLEKMRKGSG
jgi:hypothetical protein